MAKPTKTAIDYRQAGFTLIEVMVGITVLAVAILAINGMQTSSISGNVAANLISGRTGWASDRMEQIIGMDYDDIVSDSATSYDNAHQASWTVTDDSPINNTKTIVLTITDIRQGRTATFSLIRAKVL